MKMPFVQTQKEVTIALVCLGMRGMALNAQVISLAICKKRYTSEYSHNKHLILCLLKIMTFHNLITLYQISINFCLQFIKNA